MAEGLPAQPAPRGKGVPAFADLPQVCDQLVTLATEDVLLTLESADGAAEVTESVEGVGARAPSALQHGQRVGGVPLCGHTLLLSNVPDRCCVVLLPLPFVRARATFRPV
ncbi:hypothetical protein HII28_03215 [Planctomonas sp. JC2975]|uniref:hypothetical protein n=1 Tax=Planctomonas sp. JC2975 TaxID=2729626 RepID=UPI0014759880|nr:hypothetical protein [Planctomonas sp. JC2975]NNC10890.1 hypothetical protein [Planctomonas sp. JC2975]